MRRLFRLSQTFKPEASVDQYVPVLNDALDALTDTPLEAAKLETKLNNGSLAVETPPAIQTLLQGYFGSMSDHWERLNARRLELEALRPEHRLSTVHEYSVATLRGELRLINLRGEVYGHIANSDITAARSKQNELDYWSDVVKSVKNKLGAALRRVQVEQPDLFARFSFPLLVLEVFDLDAPSAGSAHSYRTAAMSQSRQGERTAAASGPNRQTSGKLTNAIEQLIHQAAMLRLEAAGTFEPEQAKELYARARRELANAEGVARHLRDHFGIEAGDLEARTMAAVSSQLSDILSQPTTEAHGAMARTGQSATEEGAASRLIEPSFAPGRTDPDPLLIEFAQLQRHHFLGEPSPVNERSASRLTAVIGFFEYLNEMMLDDERRDSLSPHQLWLHLYDKILTYAYTNDREVQQQVNAAYQYAHSRLTIPERLRLVNDVFSALDADVMQCTGMMPFMFIDPDISVESTAALNYVQLRPLESGDPMTGPRHVMNYVRLYNRNDENDQQVAAWVCGVLALGDRRTLPVVRGVWNLLGPLGQSVLMNAHTDTGRVTAAHVEFCLEWLEAVVDDPKRAHFAANALGMLGQQAGASGVFDFERTLPAPIFEAPTFDDRSGSTELGLTRETQVSPIRVLKHWAAPEYARVVGRRLHSTQATSQGKTFIAAALVGWGPIAMGTLD